MCKSSSLSLVGHVFVKDPLLPLRVMVPACHLLDLLHLLDGNPLLLRHLLELRYLLKLLPLLRDLLKLPLRDLLKLPLGNLLELPLLRDLLKPLLRYLRLLKLPLRHLPLELGLPGLRRWRWRRGLLLLVLLRVDPRRRPVLPADGRRRRREDHEEEEEAARHGPELHTGRWQERAACVRNFRRHSNQFRQKGNEREILMKCCESVLPFFCILLEFTGTARHPKY